MRKFIHNDMVLPKLFTALTLTSQGETLNSFQSSQLDEQFSRFSGKKMILKVQKALK